MLYCLFLAGTRNKQYRFLMEGLREEGAQRLLDRVPGVREEAA